MATNLKKISSLNTIDSGLIGGEDLLYLVHKAPGQYISYNVKLEDIFIASGNIESDMYFYSTTAGSTLFITNEKIGINNSLPTVELDISGSVTADGVIRFTKNEESTSTITGSVRVVGGMGVSGNIYAGGMQETPIGDIKRSTAAFTTLTANNSVYFNKGTDSSSISTGTLVVYGGVGISQNIVAGGIQNTPIGGSTRNTGAFTTLTSNGATTFTSSTASTSSSTGAVVVTGGLGVGGSIYGGSIQNTPIGSLNRNSGAFTTLTSNGSTTFTAGIASNSKTSGSLVVTGGVGVSGSIYSDNINAVSNLTANTASINTMVVETFTANNIIGTIQNTPIGTITASDGVFTTLTANNTTSLTKNQASTSTTTGTLIVTGGVGVSGNVYAGGIQNTPIGNTVRNSGAFTSLTANNVVTFNSGALSANTTSGAVVVTGGLGVSGNINCNSLDSAIDISSPSAEITNLTTEHITANNATIQNLDLASTEGLLLAFLDKVYPIGSLYFNTLNDENPQDTLGFGTWTPYAQGRTIVGVDTTDTDPADAPNFNGLNLIGGSKWHTLTIAEMPSHTHPIPHGSNNQNSGSDTSSDAWTISSSTRYTNATGGGQRHDNVQPYITTYIWKRTA